MNLQNNNVYHSTIAQKGNREFKQLRVVTVLIVMGYDENKSISGARIT